MISGHQSASPASGERCKATPACQSVNRTTAATSVLDGSCRRFSISISGTVAGTDSENKAGTLGGECGKTRPSQKDLLLQRTPWCQPMEGHVASGAARRFGRWPDHSGAHANIFRSRVGCDRWRARAQQGAPVLMRCSMRIILVFCSILACAAPIRAAVPAQSPAEATADEFEHSDGWRSC